MRIPHVTRPLRYTRHTVLEDMVRHQENARYIHRKKLIPSKTRIPFNHRNRISIRSNFLPSVQGYTEEREGRRDRQIDEDRKVHASAGTRLLYRKFRHYVELT